MTNQKPTILVRESWLYLYSFLLCVDHLRSFILDCFFGKKWWRQLVELSLTISNDLPNLKVTYNDLQVYTSIYNYSLLFDNQFDNLFYKEDFRPSDLLLLIVPFSFWENWLHEIIQTDALCLLQFRFCIFHSFHMNTDLQFLVPSPDLLCIFEGHMLLGRIFHSFLLSLIWSTLML